MIEMITNLVLIPAIISALAAIAATRTGNKRIAGALVTLGIVAGFAGSYIGFAGLPAFPPTSSVQKTTICAGLGRGDPGCPAFGRCECPPSFRHGDYPRNRWRRVDPATPSGSFRGRGMAVGALSCRICRGRDSDDRQRIVIGSCRPCRQWSGRPRAGVGVDLWRHCDDRLLYTRTCRRGRSNDFAGVKRKARWHGNCDFNRVSRDSSSTCHTDFVFNGCIAFGAYPSPRLLPGSPYRPKIGMESGRRIGSDGVHQRKGCSNRLPTGFCSRGYQLRVGRRITLLTPVSSTGGSLLFQ